MKIDRVEATYGELRSTGFPTFSNKRHEVTLGAVVEPGESWPAVQEKLQAIARREVCKAFGDVEKEEKPSRSTKVRRALERARHAISTLNGLVAADGEAPGETWTIDERDVVRYLDEAIESFGSDRGPF